MQRTEGGGGREEAVAEVSQVPCADRWAACRNVLTTARSQGGAHRHMCVLDAV